jgi:hypothetical protein
MKGKYNRKVDKNTGRIQFFIRGLRPFFTCSATLFALSREIFSV